MPPPLPSAAYAAYAASMSPQPAAAYTASLPAPSASYQLHRRTTAAAMPRYGLVPAAVRGMTLRPAAAAPSQAAAAPVGGLQAVWEGATRLAQSEHSATPLAPQGSSPAPVFGSYANALVDSQVTVDPQGKAVQETALSQGKPSQVAADTDVMSELEQAWKEFDALKTKVEDVRKEEEDEATAKKRKWWEELARRRCEEPDDV